MILSKLYANAWQMKLSILVDADKTTVSYEYNQNHALPSRAIKN